VEPKNCPEGVAPLKRPELYFEGLFRLNGQADRDVGGTVERLKHFVAQQARVFALHTGPRRQLDAAITGMAGWTGEIRFLHFQIMPQLAAAFQPEADQIFSWNIDLSGKTDGDRIF
jgi:hypothetical protein